MTPAADRPQSARAPATPSHLPKIDLKIDLHPGAVDAESRADAGSCVRVAAVVPCHNRPDDAAKLLADLSRLALRVGRRRIELEVVLVDNASATPLTGVPIPPGLRVRHVRSERNTGGAGGFNTGLRAALRVDPGPGVTEMAAFTPGSTGPLPEFVWLVDSDARVTRRSLATLVEVLLRYPGIVAAGSALRDSRTGKTYEIGGRIDPANGTYGPMAHGDLDQRALVDADYLAACSALVRRSAIERTGLFPDIFLNGDDVLWFIRMRQATGGRVAGVARSVVFHPQWERKFQTWARYYVARNALSPISASGFGALTRFRRVLIECRRALGEVLMDQPALAQLHLDGVRDALAGALEGAAPPERLRGAHGIVSPITSLGAALREAGNTHSARPVYIHPLLLTLPLAHRELRAQLCAGVEGRALAPTGIADSVFGPLSSRAAGQLPRLRFDPDSRREASRTAGSGLRDWAAAAWRFVRGPRHDVAIVPNGRITGLFRARTSFFVTPESFFRADLARGTILAGAARVLWRGLRLALRAALKPPAPVDLAPITLPSAPGVIALTPAPAATESRHAGAPAHAAG